jgi:hypothetical protein
MSTRRPRLHSLQNPAHAAEFRMPFERAQTRIGQHLEEPRTSALVGCAQFLQRRFGISKHSVGCGRERTQDEAFPAKPAQTFQNPARLVAAPRARQRIGVYGRSQIGIGMAGGELLSQPEPKRYVRIIAA